MSEREELEELRERLRNGSPRQSGNSPSWKHNEQPRNSGPDSPSRSPGELVQSLRRLFDETGALRPEDVRKWGDEQIAKAKAAAAERAREKPKE